MRPPQLNGGDIRLVKILYPQNFRKGFDGSEGARTLDLCFQAAFVDAGERSALAN